MLAPTMRKLVNIEVMSNSCVESQVVMKRIFYILDVKVKPVAVLFGLVIPSGMLYSLIYFLEDLSCHSRLRLFC